MEDPEGWFSVPITCAEENSEAFAGQHNKNSTGFFLFDESSLIPDKILGSGRGWLDGRRADPLISREVIAEAQRRTVHTVEDDPLIASMCLTAARLGSWFASAAVWTHGRVRTSQRPFG